MKQKNTAYWILLFLIMFSCSNFQKSSKNNAVSDQDICKEYFAFEDYCERVNFLEKQREKINSSCLRNIIINLHDKTGVSGSFELGFGGMFYLNDSLFKTDIIRWKEKLNCSN